MKSITIIFLLGTIFAFVVNSLDLKKKYHELAYWEQTENIFSIWAGTGLISHEFYEPTEELMKGMDEHGESVFAPGVQVSDYHKLYEFEQNIVDFIHLMKKEKDAFLLDPYAFYRSYEDWENPEMGWMYQYEQDKLLEEAFEWEYEEEIEPDPIWEEFEREGTLDLVRPQIYLSKNYFHQNPITATTGENVLDLLQIDTLTQNVVLPESYRAKEEVLRKYFLQNFYGNRVEMVNYYRENLGLPLLEITSDDLTIQFIYAKEGQSYFSYDKNAGDEQSLIWDPIAVVHNDDIAVPQIAGRLRHLFFVDDSRGQAFENIRPLLEETGVTDVQSVISVFATGNEELLQIQWQLFHQMIEMIWALTFSLLLCLVLIWSYYSLHAYEINLRYLFGYSYWESNKQVILSVVIANVLGFGILTYFHGFQMILVLATAMLSCLDLLIIYQMSKRLRKKNLTKILKGGEFV